MRGSALLACALGALCTLSCAGLRFQEKRFGLEPDLAAARALTPGVSSLADCLAALGAPHEVEKDESLGGGRVLSWKWEAFGGWGFFFSLPLSDWWSPSLNYDAAKRRPRHLHLIFDERWVLREAVLE